MLLLDIKAVQVVKNFTPATDKDLKVAKKIRHFARDPLRLQLNHRALEGRL